MQISKQCVHAFNVHVFIHGRRIRPFDDYLGVGNVRSTALSLATRATDLIQYETAACQLLHVHCHKFWRVTVQTERAAMPAPPRGPSRVPKRTRSRPRGRQCQHLHVVLPETCPVMPMRSNSKMSQSKASQCAHKKTTKAKNKAANQQDHYGGVRHATNTANCPMFGVNSEVDAFSLPGGVVAGGQLMPCECTPSRLRSSC